MRVETGIEGLDKLIEGGFPEKSSILLLGPAGSGRTTFSNQFLYHGLEKGEAAIYILFNAPPQQVKEEMKKFGWNIEGKIIIFIDVYSWRTGGSEEKYVINDPTDLNTFNIAVSQAIKELEGKNLKRCSIDSLSTLFLYVPSDLCIRFSSVLLAKLKKAGTTQLVIIDKGAHDEKILASLNSITDGTIELDIRDGERVMRVARMRATKHPLEPFRFRITDKGIVV
ncbi:hypothetical protein DRN32_07675 [Thermococci archaeon]|nr:MAG: hypothetical protein DRN32_07675 [Thermococci archaeon]